MFESGKRICDEAGLRLFPISDDRGASLFQTRDGVTEGRLLGSFKLLGRNPPRRMSTHRGQQVCCARDASNRFGRYRHVFVSQFPNSELEIQPDGKLNLSCWCYKIRGAECRIGRTADSVSILPRNRPKEVRGAINCVNAINVWAVKQIENFGTGFRLDPFPQIEHSLQAHVGSVGGISSIRIATDSADAVGKWKPVAIHIKASEDCIVAWVCRVLSIETLKLRSSGFQVPGDSPSKVNTK